MAIEIFIPFWSRADLLERAISSVLAQSDPRWTLTIVDDASPEDVTSIVCGLDSRVRYLRNPTNLGISGNFQRCLDLASQEYVCIMGADDELLPCFVELTLSAGERFPSADIIEVGVDVIDEEGRSVLPLADRVKRLLTPNVPKEGAWLVGEPLAVSLLRGNWLYWPSLTFRTGSAQRAEFRSELLVIQDLAFMIDLIRKGAALAFVPTKGFRYRRHRASAAELARVDGRRFDGETKFFRETAQLMKLGHWNRASRVARLRVIARLHAVMALPAGAFHGGLKAALKLAFGL